MPRVIAKYVKITDEDGYYVSYQPGDVVPDNHVAFITNEAVWGDPPAPETNDLIEKKPVLADLSYRRLLELARKADLEFSKSPKKQEVIQALEAANISAEEEPDT